ncbi:MAG: alkyl sulfatase dimerization domain-containing protein, partial [Pseudomonadota bacterium]
MRYLAAILITSLCACGAPEPVQEEAAVLGPSSADPTVLPAVGVATQATVSANAALAERLALDDQGDFRDADRGLVAQIEAPAILDNKGNKVWDIEGYGFVEGTAPSTVNPSLWRQSKLNARHGLFKVADGLWQVRGYDLSVMSVIEGETGWIIVDPLTSVETAAAALKLVNDTLGTRPVTGLLYTHSHIDHFGGARGVMNRADALAREVPILAPIGFSESAVSENLLAGQHMARRASLMFGNTLSIGPQAHVGSGLGPGVPFGTSSLILPTEEIAGRGTQRIIDGVTFEFIDAAGTEAPAEFMFYLPEKRALCTAEVATATFHNILTPRGAKARNALTWSKAIDYVLAEYGAQSDVVFASHHWPTWGTENIQTFLKSQRDIYRYTHDQTLRRANAGETMVEIAEAIAEPPMQSAAFDTRGYYGTLNHNAKAVYQYYFGWWGGVPAEYNELPHELSAPRYVQAMGGANAVLRLGIGAFEAGEYRWAAELFNHIVFADPENGLARDWLAASYEQLGFQAESGTWRSYFLAGAEELRRGVPKLDDPVLGQYDFLKAVRAIDLFDAMAARYNPDKMDREPFVVTFQFPDTEEIVSVHVG